MLLLVLLCAVVSHVYSQDSPVVETTIGSVQGAVASDGEYFTFYGVPYGGSTAGDNRFKAPTPAPVFDEVFDATDDSVLCAQAGPNGPTGVEDCLRLNIFTNNLTDAKPVLVWVIGEEFTTSNPVQHSFRKLIEKIFVVVSLNYRLSVFGFLCLGIEEAPGNVGLKDVIQGLQWIQGNIAAFGGDPNNVVLFGHGSGAAMVDLITMSPLAKDLVHKAIYHSGSALSPWAVSYDPIGSAKLLHDRIERSRHSRANQKRDSRTEELQNLVEVLKSATVNELVQFANVVTYKNGTVLFAACIENVELNSDKTFLHDAPINLLRDGDFLHIPVIAGYTDKEGTLRVNEGIGGWFQEIDRNFTNFLPADLNLENTVRETLSNTIRDFYFNDNSVYIRRTENYFQYHGDILIIIPVLRSILLRRLKSLHFTYLLEFTYRGTNNSDWVFENIELTGAPHGGVLNFLLDFDLRGRDSEVMDSLLERYHNFGRFGSPWEFYPGLMWYPLYSFASLYIVYDGGYATFSDTWWYMQFLRSNPHSHHYAFWSAIYDQHYRVPSPVSSAARSISFSISVLFSIFWVLL